MSEFDLRVRSRPGVAIAAVASTVPEHCIDQRATRDIVLSIAPQLRSHEAPIVSFGAYRLFKHPNYAITAAETLLLPVAFSAVALGLIMTAIWVAVLNYKIRLEDAALATRRGSIPP